MFACPQCGFPELDVTESWFGLFGQCYDCDFAGVVADAVHDEVSDEDAAELEAFNDLGDVDGW